MPRVLLTLTVLALLAAATTAEAAYHHVHYGRIAFAQHMSPSTHH